MIRGSLRLRSIVSKLTTLSSSQASTATHASAYGTLSKSSSSLSQLNKSMTNHIPLILQEYTDNPRKHLLKDAIQILQAEIHRVDMRDSALKKFVNATADSPAEALLNQKYAALSLRSQVVNAVVETPKADPDEVSIERINKDVTLTIAVDEGGETVIEKILLSSRWVMQRTIVDMGLNMHALTFTVTMPHSLLDRGLRLAGRSRTARQVIAETGRPPSGFIEEIATLGALTEERSTDHRQWITVQLCATYGNADRPGPSTLTEPALDTLDALHSLVIEVPSPSSSSSSSSSAASSLRKAPNMDKFAACKELTQKEFAWWLSYFLTHPSNWAFDRMSNELLGPYEERERAAAEAAAEAATAGTEKSKSSP